MSYGYAPEWLPPHEREIWDHIVDQLADLIEFGPLVSGVLTAAVSAIAVADRLRHRMVEDPRFETDQFRQTEVRHRLIARRCFDDLGIPTTSDGRPDRRALTLFARADGRLPSA